MTENKQAGNFWTTVPGILTAIAGLVTAVAGLFASYNTILETTNKNPAPTPSMTSGAAIATGVGINSQQSGTLNISAKNKEGVKFTNPTGKVVNVYFRPNGESLWSVGRDWGSVSSRGYETPQVPINQDRLRCPNHNIGALVVEQNGQCESVGQGITLKLVANEEVSFFMNELPNFYDDNQGFVPVSWSIE
ncbi:hypothetical protein ACX27_04550 [Nostoc piscinale CENA21]|uniref:Uncharacterized protein n=1 Tax=Nostoc piscinale CENA21 TaxID=224013 RepID=A0A0M5MG90_9NOSO|nr:hypothetical protein [Nostoc piscinale]ALF52288.1 hypothetical protein ACX27_04550 [Nostoc piscinale CENA21]